MDGILTFLIVLAGWVFSLTLHEFAHAFVAYRGGDWTVREKGYLTFNPLKYTHPVYSIALPLLFLVLGGIGLPGGAVYIQTHLLRSKHWQTAVSLAGPFSNLLVAVLLGGLLQIVPVSISGIWPGLAFLALLQVTAFLFNMLPIPPFDGYGALRPHLSWNVRENMDRFGQVSLFVVLLAFWYLPFVGQVFWGLVGWLARLIGIPLDLALVGQSLFLFWR
ncbi:MAG: site-2 protease family protein [Anaerolineae bacterium]|nr:MAG: site-2 protease family protein [Anaerolineae bacterium]